jgi:hypothetical protein
MEAVMAANGKRTLEDILEEHLEVTKAGFDQVTQNLAETSLALRLELATGFKQVDARFQQIDGRFQQLDKRLDNLLRTAGARGLDHEQRLQALEAEVAKLKG